MEETGQDIWIFGYGSLVWKTNFAYTESLVGRIKHFKRRFWQGSSDHRGTVQSPGRVATILPSDSADDQVWGLAYKLDKSEIETTFTYLNHREKNGYELQSVTFYPQNGSDHFDMPIYISSEDNPYFLGEAPLEEMARHIYTSRGPSGSNLEYFLNLLNFMKTNVPEYEDVHLSELDGAIMVLMQAENKGQDENHCFMDQNRQTSEMMKTLNSFIR